MKIWNKVLCSLLVVVLCLTSAPLQGFVGLEWPEWSFKSNAANELAATGQCGDNVYWSFDSNTGELTISGTGAMWDYQGISSPFYDNISIESIFIETGITTIGAFVFYCCEKLKNVIIPNGVISINKGAFWGTGIISITIPDSVSTIEDSFDCCSELTSITVNKNNKNYSSDSSGVLFNKEKTTLIRYPAGKNNKSYSIPDSVTTIGNNAFSCCKLVDLPICNNVQIFGDSAFSFCDNLTRITIPNSVTTIGDKAFNACWNLTNINISSNVTSIGDLAFHNCGAIERIVVDETNLCYSSDDFGVLFNKVKTSLLQYPRGNDNRYYTVPDTVETIVYPGFSHCENLYSISLGNNLKTIGIQSFWGCTYLKSINIPGSVTTISSASFDDCVSLETVTIEDGVTTIDSYSFADCKNLNNIMLPDSIICIDYHAFSGCTNLTSATIPASVTKIGFDAFSYCNSLTDVYFNGTEEQWNSIIIEEENEELLHATIHFLGDDEPELDSYRLQLRSDGRYSDSIAIGKTIGFYTYLSKNGKLLDCERAYAISFDNAGIFEVVDTEITKPSFDVTLRAKKVGTTNMTISDNITGAYVTIRLKANNPKEIITMDEVKDLAKEYQKDKLTNFYDYNGLYIDGYFYQEYSDGSYRAYMNAYNEKAYYGAVVSYDKNGNIVDHRLIKPQDKLPTSIWSGFIDSIDVIDDHLKKFKDKYLYDEPTFTKHSDVDELKVPEGGYFVITNNYLENEYVFFANTIDIALDLMFAYSSTKKVDIPDSLSEKVVEKTIKDLLEEIGKDALKSIYKKMIKVFTKGITIDNVDAFMSTLVGVFKEYEIDFEGMIKEVVDDLNDTETKLDFAEDALLTILGAGTVKEVLSSLGYINTAIKLIDIFSGSLSSEIIIYTPPEEEKTRTSNGVKVTSETPLDPDYVLHTYVINQNDDLMTDAVPTIDPLADNYNMYDITLYKSSQAVQPNAKIKVMIPIPAGYDKSRIAVYWYKEDGTLEKMNATVNGSYAIFETDHLSCYVLVEEHVHTYGEDGEICTDCGFDRTEGCGCNCHKTGIAGFFWKIINFFNKIFKIKQYCKCGINHY